MRWRDDGGRNEKRLDTTTVNAPTVPPVGVSADCSDGGEEAIIEISPLNATRPESASSPSSPHVSGFRSTPFRAYGGGER